MKRYFQWNVEDAVRIAEIESDDHELIYEVAYGNAEIDEADLPEDWATWKEYTGFAHTSCGSIASVIVKSAEGK